MKKLPQIVYSLANEFLKFKMVKNVYSAERAKIKT